jgi:hypothetical protein
VTLAKARLVAASLRYKTPRTLRDAALALIEHGEWEKAQRLADRATAIERRLLARAA